jgi:hypothetical protein
MIRNPSLPKSAIQLQLGSDSADSFVNSWFNSWYKITFEFVGINGLESFQFVLLFLRVVLIPYINNYSVTNVYFKSGNYLSLSRIGPNQLHCTCSTRNQIVVCDGVLFNSRVPLGEAKSRLQHGLA